MIHLLRRWKEITASVLIVVILACSPATLASYAEKIGRYTVKTRPIFETLNNAEILKRIDQIDADTKILAAALRAGADPTTILATTAKVIDAIEALIDSDLSLIPDVAKRAKVGQWLTVAEIALGILVESFPNTHHAELFATQEQKQAIEVVRAFKKNVRCRMAGSVFDNVDKTLRRAGQFAPFRMCEKYPDQTVVERIKPKPKVITVSGK